MSRHQRSRSPHRHRFALLAAVLVLTTIALPAYRRAERDPARTTSTLTAISAVSETGTPTLWVRFVDKAVESSEDCARALAALEPAVSRSASDRRRQARHADDFDDLPIPAAYVAAIEATGAVVVHESRWLNAVSVRADLETFATLAELPFVASLERVASWQSTPTWRVGRPPKVVADTVATGADGIDYGASRGQIQSINAVAAHASGLDGEGVVVALLDTDVDLDHLALRHLVASDRILARRAFVSPATGSDARDAHGTAILSALAGYADGMLVGPAFGASFLLACVDDPARECGTAADAWVAALEWAEASGADVVVTSVDTRTAIGDPEFGESVETVLRLANDRGLLVVGPRTAAKRTPASPVVVGHGRHDASSVFRVVSDGYTRSADRDDADPTTPRTGTVCALADGDADGTSPEYGWMAGPAIEAALVAGAAALVMDAHPTWPAAAVRDALELTDLLGGGVTLPDVAAAVANTCPTALADGDHGEAFDAGPNPFRCRARLTYDLPDARLVPVTVEIRRPDGTFVRGYRSAPRTGAISWDGRDRHGRRQAPGTYVATLSAGEWHASAKLVLDP